MASIIEVFDEKYPELSKQLDELGVKDTETLVERFKSNGKYLNEVLDYDLKDNEKIRSIAESFKGETVHKRYKDDTPMDWLIWVIIFIVMMVLLFI